MRKVRFWRKIEKTMRVLWIVVSLLKIVVGGDSPQCERITAAACQGLGYNMTSMPNLAGHKTQMEAELRVSRECFPFIYSY